MDVDVEEMQVMYGTHAMKRDRAADVEYDEDIDYGDENRLRKRTKVVDYRDSDEENGGGPGVRIKSGPGGDTGALSNDEQQPSEPEDELTDANLIGAAHASRCHPNIMSDQEKNLFPDILRVPNSHKVFLFFRNAILNLFLSRPQNELTWDVVMREVDPARYGRNHPELLRRVYEYLRRVGLINFGVYHRLQPIMKLDNRPRIVVIGAGVAGLTAARQLQSFGFDVVVLEARARVGGRVTSFRKNNFVADLGAMVVTGLGGNPLAVVARQISMELFRLRTTCPLYDTSGELVPKSVDDMVEKEFNRLLEASAYLAHHLNFSHVGSSELSVGQALEWIIKLQERHVKQKHLEHLKKVSMSQDALKKVQSHVVKTQRNITAAQSRISQASSWSTAGAGTESSDFEARSAQFDLQSAYKTYDRQMTERQQLEIQLQQLEETIPSEVYLSVRDRQVLDWHFANLEFANATPLSTLSLKYWDQDDDYEFSGPHMTVRYGYSQLPSKLAEDLDVRLETPVRNISYTENGVEVIASNPTPSCPPVVHTANAALITIPLGVLKANTVSFTPPLPSWKADAIRRLGFGNLNKVVLCFEKAFWDPTINLFGHVNPTTTDRGEVFLFWNMHRAPTLIALVAGEAATNMERYPDHVAVGKALEALRHIFGEANVPPPVESVVTRWKTDEWAQGSYSYVAVGATGADYDFLSSPVTAPGAAPSQTNRPTLFFAGEHTSRNYPATVHGALLSGLREAGRIADQFFGRPYARKESAGSATSTTTTNGAGMDAGVASGVIGNLSEDAKAPANSSIASGNGVNGAAYDMASSDI